MSVVSNEDIREKLKDIARNSHKGMIEDRGTQIEADVLTVIRYLFTQSEQSNLSLKEITNAFNMTFGNDHPVSTKWIGALIRKSLNLKPYKSHGNYILPPREQEKLSFLYERYGVTKEDTDQLTDTLG